MCWQWWKNDYSWLGLASCLFVCSIKMLLLIMNIILMMIMMLLRDKTFSLSCWVDKLKECFCVRAEKWSDQAAPTVISDICVCTACCSFPVFLLYFFIVFLWYFFDILSALLCAPSFQYFSTIFTVIFLLLDFHVCLYLMR